LGSKVGRVVTAETRAKIRAALIRESIRACLRCSRPYAVREWKLRQGKGKYCSPKCGLAARIENQKGKPIHSPEDKARRRERMIGDKNPMFGRSGEANPNWKGGRTVDGRFGYVLILAPGHPRAHKGEPGGYVYEHILVAEQKLGRPILPEERVHHIDGNPANNLKDNIDVFPNGREHSLVHEKRRIRNGLGQYS
jgi:hypothetical protein